MKTKKQEYVYYVMFFSPDAWTYIAKSHVSEWWYVSSELIKEIEETLWEDDAILNVIYMWEY